MKSIGLRAYAKVNYALDVLGVRPDGYHDIRTVFQSISLADEVEIERSLSGFELVVEPEAAAVGPVEENTAYKAWKLLCKEAKTELGVRVSLHKEIPTGAGLGGGSADAAAALVGMNAFFGLGLEKEELCSIGAKAGADVPFCIVGGTMLGEGVGDVLGPLPAPPPHALAVLKPEASASTKEIYAANDRGGRESEHRSRSVAEALEAGDLAALARSIGNDLTPISAALVPEVEEYRRLLLEAGALGAAMSGTGSAVYGIFHSKSDAERAAATSRAHFAGVCEPVERGVEVVETL